MVLIVIRSSCFITKLVWNEQFSFIKCWKNGLGMILAGLKGPQIPSFNVFCMVMVLVLDTLAVKWFWTVRFLLFKITVFYVNICMYNKCNLFLWSKLYFQHHYCSLQCHMIFRNHSDIMICCSKKHLLLLLLCWKQLSRFFSGFFDE